ncbi:hypothetical protein [Glaciimonas soli]|nr:hypothetical protein [Glaciimonas soli]
MLTKVLLNNLAIAKVTGCKCDVLRLIRDDDYLAKRCDMHN